MQSRILIAVLASAALVYAKEPKRFETGVLLKMESVECGFNEKSGQSLTGQLIGTEGAHRTARQLLCQEYVLQSDRVTYRIRPKDEKHPALLPVGENARFRLDKDKMKLRLADADEKEKEYIVVSMTPREDTKPAPSASSNAPHH